MLRILVHLKGIESLSLGYLFLADFRGKMSLWRNMKEKDEREK